MKQYLFAAIIIIGFSCLLFAQTEPIEPMGDGTQQSPYEISSLANLRWLSEVASAWGTEAEPVYILQTQDIDATETELWNDGEGFSPIGRGVFEGNTMIDYSPFIGEYDGGNHSISNLYINQAHVENIFRPVGFFGLTDTAAIRNVKLVNMTINSSSTEVELGGVIGVSYTSSILNSSTSGVISTTGIAAIGGLIALAVNSSVQYCSSYMAIVSSVSVSSSEIGGLVGYLVEDSEVLNSFFRGSIDILVNNHTGGLLGSCYESTVQYCYVASEPAFLIGNMLIGRVGWSRAENNFWDYETSGSLPPFGYTSSSTTNNNVGKSTAEMKTRETFTSSGWDFENIWNIDPNINDGYPYLRERPTSIADNTVPLTTSHLLGNYPNPFNPATTIAFDMVREGHVSIIVYNSKGQRVAGLVDGVRGAGVHNVVWNGRDDSGRSVSSGIYLYRMVSGDHVGVGKMVMVK